MTHQQGTGWIKDPNNPLGMLYDGRSALSLEHIDVVYDGSNNGIDPDEKLSLDRIYNQRATITINFENNNGSEGHHVKFTTEANGKALTLSATDYNNAPRDMNKFRKLFSFSLRHPKKKWEIKSVTFSNFVIHGSATPPPTLTPYEGDISMDLHYCLGFNSAAALGC